MATVLVIGAAGYFGRLLIDDLLHHVRCEVVLGGRRLVSSSGLETRTADLFDRASLARALNEVDIVICTAGPYQQLPLFLVELCLQRGIHYIDLADNRDFVQRVHALTAKWDHVQSAVCAGWSTVSALSGLLAKIASNGMKSVESIYVQMAPGNRGARQAATIASLLHSVGREFRITRNGQWHNVTGWSDPRDFLFPPPIGKRRGYLVDVPDHAIFPDLFAARTVEFRAGLELAFLNGCLSLLRRTRKNWTGWAGLFQRAAALLSWVGHDSGAIGVEVTGSGRQRACVVADSRGERIATMPATVMTGLLISGRVRHGLVSYSDWLSAEQLRMECDRRGFRLIVEEY